MRTAPSVGIRQAALHEFYGEAEADAASVAGLMLALALQSSARPILWVRQDCIGREAGTPYPPGLKEFGMDPARIIFVRARDVSAILQAGLEGARCAALGAVLIELWGEAKALDLTASRRLSLAAKASGTIVLMARIAAQPCPSAAETRWAVRAAPSRPLAANATGNPAFSLRLLRHRGGIAQGSLHWEWNRDGKLFENSGASTVPAHSRPAPPVSGLVVPVSFDRQVSAGNVGPAHRKSG